MKCNEGQCISMRELEIHSEAVGGSERYNTKSFVHDKHSGDRLEEKKDGGK